MCTLYLGTLPSFPRASASESCLFDQLRAAVANSGTVDGKGFFMVNRVANELFDALPHWKMHFISCHMGRRYSISVAEWAPQFFL